MSVSESSGVRSEGTWGGEGTWDEGNEAGSYGVRGPHGSMVIYKPEHQPLAEMQGLRHHLDSNLLFNHAY